MSELPYKVLGDLIEKAEALLDFYYDVNIDRSEREISIKFDLEESIENAKKYHSEL